MRRWVVTGPIGAGKSAVTALLAARGAAILDGDALGHEILARPEVTAAIAAAFGPETAPGGAVDRRALGALVFGNPAAMARLNALTHGPLAALMSERLDALEASGRHGLAVLEAAVYFLLPSPPRADLVLAVTAAAARRVARLAARGLDESAARTRIRAQAGLEDLWTRADVIIDNDGTARELARAVDDLWRSRGLPETDPAPREETES